MRYAFYMYDKKLKQKLVAKVPLLLKPDITLSNFENDTKTIVYCRIISQMFNERVFERIKDIAECNFKLITFVDSWVYEFNNLPSKLKFMSVENFINGDYVKYNNNMGQILKVEKTEKELQEHQEEFLKKNPSYYKEGSNVMNFIETY